MSPELTVVERVVLEMLRSNDPEAVTSLAALDDAASVRVLAVFRGETVSSDKDLSDPSEAGVAPSEAGVAPSEAGVAPSETEAAPPSETEVAPPGGRAVGLGAGLLRLGFLKGLSRKILGVVLGVVVLFGGFLFLSRDASQEVSGSDVLLLVRVRAGDLYIGEVGEPFSRDNRLVTDLSFLWPLHIARDQGWFDATVATVGDHTVVAANAGDVGGAWVASGLERGEFTSEGGTVDVSLVDSTLYLREVRDETLRCYSGSLADIADLERLFRGDFCDIARSGHVLGADRSGGTFAVTVWSPQGEGTGIVETNFSGLPALAGNGLFLVSTGDQVVTVTSVETGDRVWGIG